MSKLKQKMSLPYKLMFVFSILIIFLNLIASTITRSGSGYYLLLWGSTIWLMYKRNNETLMVIHKYSFIFSAIALSVIIILNLVSVEISRYTRTTFSSMVILGTLSTLITYGFFIFFQRQLRLQNTNETQSMELTSHAIADTKSTTEYQIYPSFASTATSKATKQKIFALIALIVVSSLGYVAYTHYSNRPAKIDSYQTLTLGMSMDEVLYSLGQPDYVLTQDHNGDPGFLDLVTREKVEKNLEGVKGYLSWFYSDNLNLGTSYEKKYALNLQKKPYENPLHLGIEFEASNKKLLSIRCSAQNNTVIPPNSCAVNGIVLQMSEESVIQHLGIPTQASILGITKSLTYNELGMVVHLEKRMVYSITVLSDLKKL